MENNNKYYRRGNGTDVIVHTSFQRADKLWPVADKLLTDEQLERLIEITPEHRWILINHPGQIHTNDPAMIESLYEKLSDDTLREIVKDEGLSQSAMGDILKSIE